MNMTPIIFQGQQALEEYFCFNATNFIGMWLNPKVYETQHPASSAWRLSWKAVTFYNGSVGSIEASYMPYNLVCISRVMVLPCV